MPRYYFDLIDDKTVYDKKGVSLPNTTEAQAFAKTFARELMETKSTLLGEDWEAWSVRISNGKFQPIEIIPFSAVSEQMPEPAGAEDTPLKPAEGSGKA
jgi:hypothetical protein